MASDLIFPALSIVRLLLALSPLGRSLKDDPQLSSPLTSYSSRKSVRSSSHRFCQASPTPCCGDSFGRYIPIPQRDRSLFRRHIPPCTIQIFVIPLICSSGCSFRSVSFISRCFHDYYSSIRSVLCCDMVVNRYNGYLGSSADMGGSKSGRW